MTLHLLQCQRHHRWLTTTDPDGPCPTCDRASINCYAFPEQITPVENPDGK